MTAELTSVRIALLVLYATTRTKRGDLVVEGTNVYTVEKLIRSRLGGAGGYGKTACNDNSKQLVELGYLEAVLVDEGSRPTTIYRPTKKGFNAVRAWTATPTTAPRIDDELFLRIALPYTRPEVALGSLRAMRPRLTGLLAVLDAEAVAPDSDDGVRRARARVFPARARGHLAWLGRAEKQLARMAKPPRRMKSASRQRR